jgi:tRNA threonylcarbamoyl adenosine modification protein YjeE
MLTTFPLPNLAATEALAKRLAPLLRTKDVVTLQGDLGAGKTTFARAVLRELGIKEEVPSPTFTLLQTYETPSFPIYHFDLYRLKSPAELEEIGFYEAGTDGLMLIEWPERAASHMSRNRLELHFSNNGEREVTLVPQESWITRLESFSA